MGRDVPKLSLLKLFTQAKGAFVFYLYYYFIFLVLLVFRTVSICSNVSVNWFRIEAPFNLDKDKNNRWLRAFFFWTWFRDRLRVTA